MAKRKNERLTQDQRGVLIAEMLEHEAWRCSPENPLFVRVCLDRYGIVDVGKLCDITKSGRRITVL
jgi:hypothetical protein